MGWRGHSGVARTFSMAWDGGIGCPVPGFVGAHPHPPIQAALSSIGPQRGPKLASFNCVSVFQGPQGPPGPVGPPGEMGAKVSAEGFVPECCWEVSACFLGGPCPVRCRLKGRHPGRKGSRTLMA